jgi:DNA-binding response OmpR family regulator
MARVVAYVPDLLFGSQVQGALRAAGHVVELVSDESAARDALADADVLIVDLTDEVEQRLASTAALLGGDPSAVGTLAFYSHVEAPTRVRGQEAGIDVVVPRSRMAREAPELVAKLV